MNKEELRTKWTNFDASLVEKDEDFVDPYVKLEEKKRVIQEIVHDDLNSENIT
jgi:hypothetical protein|tara:strand:+ start:880 stop:1038 length:159 start_codon:yes stop_codon:yes gene_type:complete